MLEEAWFLMLISNPPPNVGPELEQLYMELRLELYFPV